MSIDGRNGDIDWVYTRDLPADVFPQLCCDVVNRGVAPYGDKVYLATLDAHIVALNAASGAVEFDVMVGDYTYAETFTVMPMALEGKVIMGTAGAEYGVRGWVTARSAEDGSEVWKPIPFQKAVSLMAKRLGWVILGNTAAVQVG
jgi:alcohol dehydrogenase (cytochrome c)